MKNQKYFEELIKKEIIPYKDLSILDCEMINSLGYSCIPDATKKVITIKAV